MNNPPHPPPIGLGVIGIGFMGQTHVRAIQAAGAAGLGCRLVAVCDADPARLSGMAGAAGNLGAGGGAGGAAEPLFDPATVRTYTDPTRFLADPGLHAVHVCTYTDTHVEMAQRALAAGKHVLVEKPVALASSRVRELAAAARGAGGGPGGGAGGGAGRLCVPAMCMRFWPGWDWLHGAIGDGRFGGVRSAAFVRLGSGPRWGEAFYRDHTRSGGALVDLHIHDADFILWCFGRPAAVCAHGSADHVLTSYLYPGGGGPALVTAEGGWDLAPTAGFRMRYVVAFERATADFDLARTPQLVVHTAAGSEPVALDTLSGYEAQVRAFVRLISADAAGDGAAGTGETPGATLDEAAQVAELLEAEAESLRTGVAIRL